MSNSRTTRQMLAAPQGAIYVWPTNSLSYPLALSRHLKRYDLVVEGPIWLTKQAWRGSNISLVLDHACIHHFTNAQMDTAREILHYLERRQR
jgi:hypothetical protein